MPMLILLYFLVNMKGFECAFREFGTGTPVVSFDCKSGPSDLVQNTKWDSRRSKF